MKPSNRHFANSLTTLAPPEAIWDFWTDPSSWERWDGGLASAQLHSPSFVNGATGQIVPRTGPAARFTVTSLEINRRVVIQTRLPLAVLTLDRRLDGDGPVSVTHHVMFSGPLGWLWASIFGPGFRRELPHTMRRLIQLAEMHSP